jgi:hypothetical protein
MVERFDGFVRIFLQTGQGTPRDRIGHNKVSESDSVFAGN